MPRAKAKEKPAPARSEGLTVEDARPAMALRLVRIDELHNDAANARLHDQRNLSDIAGSLKQFGQAEPLVVQKGTNRVIGGNGRLRAMRDMGVTECYVVDYDADNVTASALGIALNRTAEHATWDNDALGQTLRALQAEEFDLNTIGFTAEEVDALFVGSDPETLGDESDAGGENLLPEKYEIIVECRDEEHQRATFERLQADGHSCRVITF